jgi:hypothetical protein
VIALTPTAATATVSLLVSLAAAPYASAHEPSPSPSRSLAPSTRIVNGNAEDGLVGFRAGPTHRVRLTTDRVSHSGSNALRLRSADPTRGHLRATSVHDTVAVGSTAVAGAWVRTARAGQAVTLTLRETSASGAVRRQHTTVRPRARTWTHVTADLVTRSPGSRLGVGVAVRRSGHRLNTLVDDVTLSVAARSTATTSARALSNGCTYSARGIPACGGYLGAAHGGNTDPALLESQLGRRLGVHRTFYTSTGVDKAVTTAKADIAKGRLPWISFKLPYSWEAMTAGQGDAWAKDVAARLALVPGPVWVAFHHEPEGDGNITAWRTMQERLAPLVRRIAPNVAYTVVVTGWHEFYGDAQYNLANIWPRGVKIDVAGFDIYNQYGVVKNGKTNTTFTDFDKLYYSKIQAWATQQGVAWGIAETGFTDAAYAARPTWIKTVYDQLLARGGVAMSYFNSTLNSIGSWALTTDGKRASLAKPMSTSAALPIP